MGMFIEEPDVGAQCGSISLTTLETDGIGVGDWLSMLSVDQGRWKNRQAGGLTARP